MSIKAQYTNGVFEPIEEARDTVPGRIYHVFSDDELRGLVEDLVWLTAAEKSFDFWGNDADGGYDSAR